MNYVWELVIKAMRQNADVNKIRFGVFDRKTSGYNELSFISLIGQETLTEDMITKVDIYPFGRFFEVFYKWASPGEDNPYYGRYPEFDENLADILVHYLTRVDMKAGMTRREYDIKFTWSDIADGVFGGEAGFSLFNIAEKRRVVSELLNLYATGDYMSCVKRAAGEIFPRMQILNKGGEEVIFYCGERESEELREKTGLIIRLFMPVNIRVKIHWEYTYGIVGRPDTIKLERFIL